MRVLQVVAELGTGGAEAVVLGLAEGMASRGHRTWVASDRGWRVPLLAEVPGVDHVRVPLAPGGPVALAASAARLLAWAPGRPVDIVHAHNIRATLAAHPVARARRAPLVTTVHGLGAQDYPRAVRVLRRCSDLVVAVSDAVAEDLERAGLPKARIRVVENSVSAPAVRPDDAAHLPDLPHLPASGPIVLCAARMTAQKRQDLLLRGWAAREHRTGHLLLAGDGPERPRHEALARELGLGADVTFLGDRDDVGALLRRADLLALPSDWEGLPIGVLEALAADVPVLASAVGGLPDLADVLALVPADGDDRELGERWGRALDRELAGTAGQEQRQRAARGRALVDTRFSPDRMVEAYLALDEALVTSTYR
ncbi:glycosyltransferase [uncultured Nocardioides sp.]|uniref:glycosyltransferase n=1 Tax=uncultured Nocardioides sp. TaxID=198441 RepID=UPI00262D0A69|nr:glycosyltransferase [uncultured Nocardioides sp.]